MRAQRYSQQREQIYETVCASKEHPTAQMVYDALRPSMPRLSLGTVYRNLQQMARDGRLMEIDGPVNRFDATVRPHTHLRCSCCGCVEDLEFKQEPDFSHLLPLNFTGLIEQAELSFSGTCGACTKQS